MNRDKVGWSEYARAYDLLATSNPAYQELLDTFTTHAQTWDLKPGDTVVDIGAGTGNYSLRAAALFPSCRIIHVEPDPVMNASARAKAGEQNISNVQFVDKKAEDVSFNPGSISALVSVHALFPLPDPKATVRRMYEWLVPDGHVFACDIGRNIDVLDWSKYLFRVWYRRHGLAGTLKLFRATRDAAKQNRIVSKLQRRGVLWTHGHSAFLNCFELAGFSIEHSSEVYRGYSDLVICRKVNST